MTVVAGLACLVPAARAIRLDPVAALRVEQGLDDQRASAGSSRADPRHSGLSL